MSLHADTVSTLGAWRPADRTQESLRQAYLGFLAAREDACQRACEPGHITASALVLNATADQTLLTLHPRVGRWLQLGGHCEPSDTTLAAAALREATEESGIQGLRIEPVPIHLDVHPITCSLGKPTRHYDVRFLVRAPVNARPHRSAESVDLQWWPLDNMPSNVDDLHPMIQAALTHLR
ncbi:NUDIX hydrolase [Saccharothrix sp. ALI-22-I]|uniref:NUDIX hydrolase n=1 Tax=Saccharothrix sp. ALI-22-I TaxID=1933778 RepID=UPI00097CA28C|nr:NUDIX hydrolase [Saccharothrix sp. ALI-22-I]ONI83710.1 NUDIX hydrolase [Saccharothrix sp. ALI-22-I]